MGMGISRGLGKGAVLRWGSGGGRWRGGGNGEAAGDGKRVELVYTSTENVLGNVLGGVDGDV